MLFRNILALPIWLHRFAVVLSFGGVRVAQSRLEGLYAASKHPVDYATGQTTFDADAIQGFYAHMIDAGTLDIYVATQRFDFVFMLMVALFGVLLGTLIARTGAPGSWGYRFGIWAACSAILGASLDACENLVSFVMLADPLTFASWLAYPYSGFAVAKFSVLNCAMGLAVLGFVTAVLGRVIKKPALG